MDIEISDGVSTPNTGKHILPPLLESIDLLRSSDLAFWVATTNTIKEDKWDQSIPWKVNPHHILEGLALTLRKPTIEHSISIWVVLETVQAPVGSLGTSIQLDGRHDICISRQKATHVVYDRSRHWTKWRNTEWVRQSPFDRYILAFLLHTNVQWRPLAEFGGNLSPIRGLLKQ